MIFFYNVHTVNQVVANMRQKFPRIRVSRGTGHNSSIIKATVYYRQHTLTAEELEK